MLAALGCIQNSIRLTLLTAQQQRRLNGVVFRGRQIYAFLQLDTDPVHQRDDFHQSAVNCEQAAPAGP